MKIWPVVMECLDVLIEERQRENSATFGKAVCERAGSEWRGVNSCAEDVPGLATGRGDQDPGGSASGRRVAEGSVPILREAGVADLAKGAVSEWESAAQQAARASLGG